MKYIILSIFISTSSLSSIFGQVITVDKEISDDIILIAHDVKNVEEFGTHPFYLKLIEFQYLATSKIKGLEGDIVFTNFLINVWDNEDNGVYWIKGQFYKPRNYTFDKEKRILTIEHGTIKRSKKTHLIISKEGAEEK